MKNKVYVLLTQGAVPEIAKPLSWVYGAPIFYPTMWGPQMRCLLVYKAHEV